MNVRKANFEVIRFEYYGDADVAFGRSKAAPCTVAGIYFGHLGDWLRFPAFRDGRVKREEIPDDNISGIQRLGFLNMRRPAFADPRVRKALGYAFDFQWTNHNLMYDAGKTRTFNQLIRNQLLYPLSYEGYFQKGD